MVRIGARNSASCASRYGSGGFAASLVMWERATSSVHAKALTVNNPSDRSRTESAMSNYGMARPFSFPFQSILDHQADGIAASSKGRPILSTAQTILAIFAASATTAVFKCVRDKRPRSHSPRSVFPFAKDGSAARAA
jgi:hypothetical protein